LITAISFSKIYFMEISEFEWASDEKIPNLKTEAEARRFWAKHSIADYLPTALVTFMARRRVGSSDV